MRRDQQFLAKLRFWWSTRCVGCKKRFRFGASSHEPDGPKHDIFWGWYHRACYAAIVNRHYDENLSPEFRAGIKESAQALANAIDEKVAADVYNGLVDFAGIPTIIDDPRTPSMALRETSRAKPAVENRSDDGRIYAVQHELARMPGEKYPASTWTGRRWLLIDGVPQSKTNYLVASARVAATLSGRALENWADHHAAIVIWPEDSILLTPVPEDQR